MAMASQGGSVDVGRVISRAFGAVGRHAVSFIALAFMLAAAPGAALEYALASGAPVVDPEELGMVVALGAGGFLLNLFSLNLLQAALVREVILDLGGRPPDLGGSLVRALALVLPLFGLTVVAGIAIMIGFVFLIVPGLFLLVIWSVAVPVMVEERLGIFDSLSRSAALTLGSRWPIFGLFVLIVLLSGVIAVVAGRFAIDVYENPIAYVLQSGVSAAINGLVGGALWASLYVELRTAKEGGTYEGLAAIFE